MELKSNRKYFTQGIWPIIAGCALIFVGALVWIIFRDERSWEIRQMYMILFAAGAVFIVLYFVIRPKDADLDEQIRKYTSGDRNTAEEKVMTADKRCQIIESFQSGCFDYQSADASLARKGTDGTVRCSAYASCVIVLANTRLYVYGKTFSLLEDKHTDAFDTIEYADITDTSISEDYIDVAAAKRTVTVKIYTLNIDAGRRYSYAIHEDSFADEFCERIKRKADDVRNSESNK